MAKNYESENKAKNYTADKTSNSRNAMDSCPKIGMFAYASMFVGKSQRKSATGTTCAKS